MALTKITGQVINDTTGLVVGVTTVGGGLSATDGFFSGIVTAVGDASFSGNVSVGGTLTYEDVTNIDAVGLVTAQNGIVVGSGITLSKDGDIFATGITTISENLKVGTGVTISPDGDGFFTGVVTATSYAGDGSNLTGIDATQIVTGNTSVQTVDTGSDGHVKITTEGSERVRIDSSGRMGIGDDSPDRELVVKHASSNSTIKIESANTHTSQLMFADSDGEQVGRVAVFHGSGQVTSNSLTLDTAGTARIRVEPAGNVNVAQNLKVAGVCTATSFSGDGSALTGLGGGVPSGCILIWSGASNAIPTGYVICDGNNSTPDLRDRFVIGAGNNYAVDATGGAATDTVTSTGNYTGATRTGTYGVAGAELVTISNSNGIINHNTNRFAISTGYNKLMSTLVLNNISVSGTVDTLPPYYALCYIMKT